MVPYALNYVTSSEDDFNYWIIYERKDQFNSLSAFLYDIGNSNRKGEECFVITNEKIYQKMLENPSLVMSKIVRQIANLLIKF